MALVPVRALLKGTEVAIRGLRAVILYGPQFPDVTDSQETLTSIFPSFPQPQQQTPS